MPTFDGGHYFLTVLVPVKTDPISDGSASTSPVHALRKRLALLPTAQQTPNCGGGQSPFARNTRNHFARFVVIDDVAYNGRVTENSICRVILNPLRKFLNRVIPNPLRKLLEIKENILAVAQKQDHLTCPFLFFAAEFDAASSADAERDSYLESLWQEQNLREIFSYCHRFDSVNDAASFAKYLASCQLETTMPFNDYYVEKPDHTFIENPEDLLKILPAWPADKILIPAGLGAILLLLGVVVWFLFCGGLMLLLVGAATLAAGLGLAYWTILKAGAKPFPPGPDLPTVLKALHLQRTFTRFAIDNQLLAAGPASAQELHTAFQYFVDVNKPSNLADPTQPPGIIGIRG